MWRITKNLVFDALLFGGFAMVGRFVFNWSYRALAVCLVVYVLYSIWMRFEVLRRIRKP